MTLVNLPLNLENLQDGSAEKEAIIEAQKLRDDAAKCYEAEEYDKSMDSIVEALRKMREAEEYTNTEFRAMLATLLFDLAEIHFALKDYKQSEKELDVLFRVLDNLLKEDQERFGSWHVMALELSTRILRTRKKTLDLLAKQQINTGMLYEKVNTGVAAATDKLVDSLRKSAQMYASTGDYRGAVRIYVEAIRLAKKRAGKVTRREVAMTVEMAKAMMHSRSEKDRAKRLLNAVLPHAVALETVELEQEILALLQQIDENYMHDPKWRTFLDKIRHPRQKKSEE